MKKILFIVLVCIGSLNSYAQLIQLYTETFEGAGHSMSLNDTTAINPPSGDNTWTVNNAYSGSPTYCNTISQDSTVSGTIAGAPYSTYMHVHDNGALPIENCNYNSSNPSDNMATTGSFCTLGIVNVKFTFFWLGQGSTDAWGELYYSRDGGAWVPCGLPQYNNQDHWKYEVVTDPGFDRCSNLRLGFRWKNGSAADSVCSSWAIDDIIAVGELDTISPITLTIDNIFPNPVCKNDVLFFEYHLSEEICPTPFTLQLSTPTGGFPGVASYSVTLWDTSGFQAILIPTWLADGSCYKLRFVAGAPYFLSFESSDCFEIIECPNTITTLNAPVMNDADTTCVQSAIDIKFYSTSVFDPGNEYIAELIDSSDGSIYFIGSSPDNTTYDPSVGSLPGTVSGLIPDVLPGCDYYIRIRSTSPPTEGTVIGPFCLKQCDVTTNNMQDLQFCIWDTVGGGACDSISLDIHSYDSLATYFAGNNFHLQLHSMMDFSLVYDGPLWNAYDTASGKWVICIPNSDSLMGVYGIAPKSYYGRIVADSTDADHGVNGTVIRVSIGAPGAMPPQIIASDTVICTGVVSFMVSPWNPDSKYEWSITPGALSAPFIWPYFPPLNVDFTGSPQGVYHVQVREINNGCYGPYSSFKDIYIVGKNEISIVGADEVCTGDTVCYYFDFTPETYYEWTLDSGTVFGASNNEACFIWNEPGIYHIRAFALNECGSSDTTFTVNVQRKLIIDAVPDMSICLGDSVELYATTDGITYDFLTENSSNTALSGEGNMFMIKAKNDITINTISVNLPNTAPAAIRVYYKAGTFVGFESSPADWTLLYNGTGLVGTGPGNLAEIPFGFYQSLSAGDSASFYITRTDGGNLIYTESTLPIAYTYKEDANIAFTTGLRNVYSFGAFIGVPKSKIWNGILNYTTKDGLNHWWNTGESTDTLIVSPTETTTYRIRISDSSGCGDNDSVKVAVSPQPTVNAGPDTAICLQDVLQLQAIATDGDKFLWTPAIFLSDDKILNPVADPLLKVTYAIQVWDSTSGCFATDTIVVDVFDCEFPINPPNAFTPNGDGNNDFFTVFAQGMETYEIRIFNRWGQMVYNSTDVTELGDLSRGWDGRFKGVEQEVGTYVFYIHATDIKGGEKEIKGNLTLVR